MIVALCSMVPWKAWVTQFAWMIGTATWYRDQLNVSFVAPYATTASLSVMRLPNSTQVSGWWLRKFHDPPDHKQQALQSVERIIGMLNRRKLKFDIRPGHNVVLVGPRSGNANRHAQTKRASCATAPIRVLRKSIANREQAKEDCSEHSY